MGVPVIRHPTPANSSIPSLGGSLSSLIHLQTSAVPTDLARFTCLRILSLAVTAECRTYWIRTLPPHILTQVAIRVQTKRTRPDFSHGKAVRLSKSNGFFVSGPAWAPQWTDARTVHHQQHTPQSTGPTANIPHRTATQQIQFPLSVDTGENEPRELDAHSLTSPVARQI